jgi:spermidine synthase
MARKPAASAGLPEATISEFDGVRSLHLGTIWIQGSMRIAQPDRVELDYVQRMLAGLLWLPAEALGQGAAAQLGLGAAALTRFTHKALRMHTTAVELNPAVIALCRRSFHLPADGPRLQVLNLDAADWVRDPAQRERLQLLHVDLYDHEAAAPALDDAAFYAGCRAVLAEGGVMSVNLFGRDASFERSLSHIVQAFGAEQVCPLRPTREGNRVVLAGRGVVLPDRAALLDRAARIEARFKRQGLPARKWLRMLRPLGCAAPPAPPLPPSLSTAEVPPR